MNAITINDEIVQQINDLENLGNTVMMLGTKENILGIIAVADQIREESKSIIERLYQLGIQKTFMLTGDNELTANAIASEVDITDVKANLLPEDKLNVIKNLQEKHKRVAMVGDGVNDAPALATASIGVRSEEHTSELQSRGHLVCRLLLEKKKTKTQKLLHRNITTRQVAKQSKDASKIGSHYSKETTNILQDKRATRRRKHERKKNAIATQ